MTRHASYAAECTPPESPFKESFSPKNMTHIHHVPTSAEYPTDRDADTCWTGQRWPSHTCNPLESNRSSSPPPVTSSPSISPDRDSTSPATKNRPTRLRRPSLFSPRVDIEDCAPQVCPCCHLRRRSSAENNMALRSPKHVHTVFDECCGKYCPDLSLSLPVSSPTARPHIGHSRLSQQLQGPHELAGDEKIGYQASSVSSEEAFDCGQNGRGIGMCAQDNGGSMGVDQDDNECWSPRDFD